MKKYIKCALLAFSLLVLSITLISCMKSNINVVFIVDGENYYTIEARENEIITMPDAPVKDEHVFDGWFIDSGSWSIPFDKNFLAESGYSSDLHVYAKWTYIHTHKAGDFIISTPPTCFAEGVMIKKCIHCDEELESAPAPILPHTEITIEGFAATETNDGLTDGSYCSVCNNIVKSQEQIPALIQGTDLKSELFEINGNVLSLLLSNSTSEISITENLKVNYKSTVALSYDDTGKIPAEDTVSLSEGDNKFYITVTNNEEAKVYELNIRRRPNYTVTFLSGDETVAEIKVEEDCLPTAPDLDIFNLGYTFGGWDCDFSIPITESKSVAAIWIPNQDTPYTVEYYIINDDGSFSLYDTKSLVGTTDSSVTAEILTIEKYAYVVDLSTSWGNILPDGTLTLKMYYRKVVFTVSFDTGCDEKIDELTVPLNSTVAPPRALSFGELEFMGWYLGDVKWNFDTDTVTADITLSAKWGYKVTFMLDGKETYIYIEKGKTLKRSDPPTKANALIFWYISGTNELWNYNTPITKSITLVGEWIPITEPDLT